jgi:hypothetical protein
MIGFGVGFYRGWKLAAILVGVCTPLLAVAAGTLTKVLASLSTKGQQAFAKVRPEFGFISPACPFV